MMKLIDTHTHPHMEGYQLSEAEFIERAEAAGVEKLVCVGTSADDSSQAIEFASRHEGYFASIGLHPHEAENIEKEKEQLAALANGSKVVAVGECGLDYYYQNSPVDKQRQALRWQLELALKHELPLIFHIRNGQGDGQAFTDFLDIIDEYRGEKIRGVVHSFTADKKILEACLKRGLYIGLNGIMTFTKDEHQLEAAKAVPLENLMLETDAPFLTPEPYRGKINNSGHVKTVAEFLSQLRSEPLEELAATTTANAEELFTI